MSHEPYRLFLPAQRSTSVLFASPHSGRDYPDSFVARSVLDTRVLRSSEDAFVDELFASAPAHGAALLAARYPRAYVDLNRDCDELDPALIRSLRRAAPNPRITSGLGVIPRVVAGGRAIYAGRLSRDEAEDRLSQVWRPYHAALRALVDETRALFGEAVLIDCHSMPHEAIAGYAAPGRPCPEVVLGARFGASAGGAITERVEAAFADAGLRVARNTPFAGAFIAQQYGRPAQGCHVIQVEIDRALYMDERRIVRGSGFDAFRAVLEGVMGDLVAVGRAAPLAAE